MNAKSGRQEERNFKDNREKKSEKVKTKRLFSTPDQIFKGMFSKKLQTNISHKLA